MDTWKRKVATLEPKCINLQMELVTIQNDVRDFHSLKEEMRIHGSLSSLMDHAVELRDAV